jgi:hypothetical protein
MLIVGFLDFGMRDVEVLDELLKEGVEKVLTGKFQVKIYVFHESEVNCHLQESLSSCIFHI